MGSIVRLPESWNTDDENPVRAARELHRLLGPHAALVLIRQTWFVVRFLQGDKDKFGINSIGERRELYPWQREVEILSAGRHFGEALYYLRTGRAKAIGYGWRPLRDQSGDWVGFTDDQGKPIDAGELGRELEGPGPGRPS
jgi:hypothetical protein